MSEINWHKIQRKLEGRCHMCGGELPKHIGVCSVFGEEMMKKYKDNEDARDKFVADQRQEANKGAKKGPVISGSDGNPLSGESSENWGDMFGGAADLAIQRKQENA